MSEVLACLCSPFLVCLQPLCSGRRSWLCWFNNTDEGKDEYGTAGVKPPASHPETPTLALPDFEPHQNNQEPPTGWDSCCHDREFSRDSYEFSSSQAPQIPPKTLELVYISGRAHAEHANCEGTTDNEKLGATLPVHSDHRAWPQ